MARRRAMATAAAVLLCLSIGVTSPGPRLARVSGAEAGPSLGEVVQRVQEACAQAQDLSARFQQTATNRSLGQVQEARGLLFLKRPGKMRWEYQKPEPRLFVTDGKTLWAYNPADKQVVVQEVGGAFASRLPLSILAGDCQLQRDFDITEVENAATKASASSVILDLKPKRPEVGIARILLEVSLKTSTVEKTTVFDAYGNTTVIALSDLRLNPGLPDQQFTFTPPAGVTVVTPQKP